MVKTIPNSPPIKTHEGAKRPDYQGALAIMRGDDPDKLVRTIELSKLEPHPLALLLPAYLERDLVELANDIHGDGLIEPITMYQDKVLDGVHRVKAAKKAGLIVVPFLVFSGDYEQARKFVYAKNVLRRHLTDDQRAGFAARFATMKSGTRTDLPPIGGRLPELSSPTPPLKPEFLRGRWSEPGQSISKTLLYSMKSSQARRSWPTRRRKPPRKNCLPQLPRS